MEKRGRLLIAPLQRRRVPFHPGSQLTESASRSTRAGTDPAGIWPWMADLSQHCSRSRFSRRSRTCWRAHKDCSAPAFISFEIC